MNLEQKLNDSIFANTKLVLEIEEKERLAVALDNTNQELVFQNAEKDRRTAELNTVLDRIDDGFFAVDKNSVVIYWNKRAEILLDAKMEDMMGKNLHEMFADSGSLAFYDHYQTAIRDNSTIHFEEFSKRTNKWFAVSAYGSDNGLSVYFKDVTDRKQAEDKIRESELRYRSIV